MSTLNGDTACDNITIIDDNVLEGDHSLEIQVAITDPMLSTLGLNKLPTQQVRMDH